MVMEALSRRVRQSWRQVNLRLSYRSDTLALLRRFEQTGDIPDAGWETDFDIYLFRHGRHDFVAAASRVLEPHTRVRLMVRLLPDSGVGDFRSKDGKTWGIGLVREIWQHSKDKDMLAQVIHSLPMDESQRTQLQSFL